MWWTDVPSTGSVASLWHLALGTSHHGEGYLVPVPVQQLKVEYRYEPGSLDPFTCQHSSAANHKDDRYGVPGTVVH